MIKCIVRVIRWLYHKVCDEKPQRFYSIDGFHMDLGDGHNLSLLMKNNQMYDRFVPFLGKLSELSAYSGGENVIVDIGANVGDTVAGFIKHTTAEIICVEPTKKFFTLLQKNVAGFGTDYSNRVLLVNAYISNNSSEMFVSRIVKGTAIKEQTIATAEAPTYTLPDMLNSVGKSLSNVSLIKVDTDGFDSDCICSLGNQLRDVSPILYWENQIDTDKQCSKFLDMVDYLSDMGYKKFFIFDNFGNYLCCVNDCSLKDINIYLRRILHGKSTRSFYYVDVLAAKNNKEDFCREIIREYVDIYE